jgi:hypothetical protein
MKRERWSTSIARKRRKSDGPHSASARAVTGRGHSNGARGPHEWFTRDNGPESRGKATVLRIFATPGVWVVVALGDQLLGEGENLSDCFDDDVWAFEGEPLVGSSARGHDLRSGEAFCHGAQAGILRRARGLL